VAAVMVVGMEPDAERVASFGVGAVGASVGPFVGEGAVGPFDAPMLSSGGGEFGRLGLAG
jgi:hypothetical protein